MDLEEIKAEETGVDEAEAVYLAYIHLGYPPGYLEEMPPRMEADGQLKFQFLLEHNCIRIEHVSLSAKNRWL